MSPKLLCAVFLHFIKTLCMRIQHLWASESIFQTCRKMVTYLSLIVLRLGVSPVPKSNFFDLHLHTFCSRLSDYFFICSINCSYKTTKERYVTIEKLAFHHFGNPGIFLFLLNVSVFCSRLFSSMLARLTTDNSPWVFADNRRCISFSEML